MDDVVAGAQLGERLERPAGGCGAAAGAAAEDLRVREEGEPEVAPDEASPGRADREQELRLLGKLLAGLDEARSRPGAGGSACGAPRPAAGRRRRCGARRGRAHAARSRPRTGRARRSRGAGPRRRTAGRPGAGRARRPRRGAPARAPLRPRPRARRLAARRSPAPRESGARGRRGQAAPRPPRRRASCTSTRSSLPLGGRIDGRGVDRVQRALRERRESADALDLVAEELDAERLAARRRVDVDDPAAQRELPALLGLVDPLVAGKRELLGERVDAGLVAGLDADRRGPRIRMEASARRAPRPTRRRARRPRGRPARAPARRRGAAAARARSPS